MIDVEEAWQSPQLARPSFKANWMDESNTKILPKAIPLAPLWEFLTFWNNWESGAYFRYYEKTTQPILIVLSVCEQRKCWCSTMLQMLQPNPSNTKNSQFKQEINQKKMKSFQTMWNCRSKTSRNRMKFYNRFVHSRIELHVEFTTLHQTQSDTN